MARLPQPGADNGNWGNILNDYLMQSHTAAGAIKDDAVGAPQLQDNAVTATALAPNSVTNASLASNSVNASTIADGTITETLLDTSVQTKLNTPSVIADDSITATKLVASVRTSLDKADTALQSAPVISVNTQTGAVVIDKSSIGLGDVDNTSDAAKPVSTLVQQSLDLKANASALSAVATSGSYVDLTNKPAIPAITDASNSTKGIVQLAGDLGGTATNPTVIFANDTLHELSSNKSTSAALGVSNTLYPTQSAVKTYVDAQVATRQPLDANATSNNATQTLTNKRIDPRVTGVASSATITPNVATDDMYKVTALAANASFAVPTGTPSPAQKLIIRIKDNGIARAVTWDAIYRAMGTPLPLTTFAGKTLYCMFIYNADDTKWDLVSAAQEV
ncbi:hypothetical protein A2707_03740 [Candidatus Saccharibacteria bacterium RIFCSPHIGHO2_01_FULL_45_15]|nr:MAG: hypothetical protein A2707_03740 [Candidatus Saccharibacteria bacterium RIFCSPHIGHO2_01_FULL_45_15]OGL28692.1 MAG: hypothetical protein A3C39_05560 [Candidatus Saccharibacteria bacterium RIFCSPHIGHO2_02_FULL_46_12]OGL31495.1 MAG: hypothetical protein A3E76_03745 [Candidatus Saccharibacteria bacterium RIFCSPHIGHO2_12_FULL_44_22]